jgi:hypothetical protein
MGANFPPLKSVFNIIVCVSLVVEYYEIKEGSIELTYDGIEALHSISREHHKAKWGSKSSNLVAPSQKTCIIVHTEIDLLTRERPQRQITQRI